MSENELEYEPSYKDDLEKFFASPAKDNLPAILEVDKEYDHLDFKEKWHEKSQLVRHILAFSNSGSGAIVIGVEDKKDGTLESSGIENPFDEANFGNKIEKYIPDAAYDLYTLETYSYDSGVYDNAVSGLTFQVVFIEGANEQAPLIATNDGSNIDEGDIYIRRNSKSETANYDEVQSLLRKRRENSLEKTTAELHEELRELKTLYDEIDRNITYTLGLQSNMANLASSVPVESKPNPNYPDEDYEEYIAILIKKKRARIEQRLGVRNMQL